MMDVGILRVGLSETIGRETQKQKQISQEIFLIFLHLRLHTEHGQKHHQCFKVQLYE